jgi:hypothetical protein
MSRLLLGFFIRGPRKGAAEYGGCGAAAPVRLEDVRIPVTPHDRNWHLRRNVCGAGVQLTPFRHQVSLTMNQQ